MNPHAKPYGAPSCGLPPGIVAAKLREWQVGDELAQFGGGVSCEGGLKPVLVLVNREVPLGQSLAQLMGGPLPVTIAGSHNVVVGAVMMPPMLDLDSGKLWS